MKDNDMFGNRMKEYEGVESKRKFIPMLPVLARLDGKSFHNWTKGCKRPFDLEFINLMQEVTKFLVEETNAKIGYVQSDEISLVWYSDNYESEIWFNGRIQKMNSVLSSMCTAKFNQLIPSFLPSKKEKLAYFDCRVWQVPNLMEASNVFLWREQDCTKNAISMAAQSMFSHKSLQGLSGKQMQEKMFQEKGINFNDYPNCAKRGTFIQRKTIKSKLDKKEISSLPEKHKARQNPDIVIERSKIEILDMPKFGSVKNRVEVIFNGEEPVIETN